MASRPARCPGASCAVRRMPQPCSPCERAMTEELMTMPEVLETSCEWSAADVADPARWTERLSASEVAEIDAAIAHAQAKSNDLLEIGKDDFPLPTLGPRLKQIEHELMYGRGFVLIR